MSRHALGKVQLPSDDDAARDRMSRTIPGVGAVDCPSKASCQLEVVELLNQRDERWEQRLQGIEQQVGEVRSILLQWAASKGIRHSSDSTPAPGNLAVEAGPVKLRGKAWLIAAVLLMLGALAAGAYVLGQWGRPAEPSVKTGSAAP